ncbi:VOC family protein [Jiangella gansuensis]|uniref:VOC family protein n=1 Tax=Jiangella gansuensis TaxID=281473 RepID=UPI00047DE1E9|nr:VOC family protein [Jiangella gansuensis]
MPQLELAGVHYVKIPVSDLSRSLPWYERVFGFRATMEFPDDDGVIRGVGGQVPGLGDTLVAFRENLQAAQGCRGFDPVGFAIADHADAENWVAHLDDLGVPHSPIIEASIGWLLVFNDPDGLELHLYTWAGHGIDHSARRGYGRPVADAAGS